MKVSEFNYELPDELIADYPADQRSASRLLCLDSQDPQVQHRIFKDLVDRLNPGDLLVFNDTKVIPARLYGRKDTGGKFEALIERLADNNQVVAQMKLSKAAKPGTMLHFYSNSKHGQDADDGSVQARVLGREGEFYRLQFPENIELSAMLSTIGHIPLPPYIDRSDEDRDEERYQTVYAKREGAVAAPTAGLHFDLPLLEALSNKGVEQAFITLHVGAGTFQSIRVESVAEHKMHSEWIEVSEAVCQQIKDCKKRGGKVVAVGTTSVRSLETCALHREFSPFQGETDIFIFPGFEFKVVDAMVTNFHLPGSSLVMLVSAFIGKDKLLSAYKQAVNERYRFFSYGDAMFITR